MPYLFSVAAGGGRWGCHERLAPQVVTGTRQQPHAAGRQTFVHKEWLCEDPQLSLHSTTHQVYYFTVKRKTLRRKHVY